LETAIEAKASKRIHSGYIRGLMALLEEQRVNKSIIVSLDHDGKGRYREGNHNGIPTSVAECLNT